MDTSFARSWLRLEGCAVLIASTLAYRYCGLSWVWFAVFFFAPDVSMLGYLVSARFGALAYNLAHFHVLSLALIVIGVTTGHNVLVGAGLISCAHTGFDRMLGYGLKSSEGFGITHLGRTGLARKQSAKT